MIKPFTENNLDISGEGFGDLAHLRRAGGKSQRWHVNVCFDEPLVSKSGDGFSAELSVAPAEAVPAIEVPLGGLDRLGSFIEAREGLVVVAGYLRPDQRTPGLRQWLGALACPIWAEASSGLREDDSLSHLMVRSDERYFTQNPPTKVLRMGEVPSLRFWRDLEALREADVLSMDPPNGYAGLARDSQVLAGDLSRTIEALPIREQGRQADLGDDREGWSHIGRLVEKYPLSEPAWLGRLSREIPQGSLVFLGNSMPIREWNLAAGYADRGLRCFASRGANGIDGQLSTFLGLTVGERESWGVFGDLTTLYDLSAPWVMEQMKAGKRRLVVVNNGGGRIFSRLPHLASLPKGKKALTENHHQRGFGHWAAMWGLGYQKVVGKDDLSMEDIATKDAIVIELCPHHEQTEDFWRELNQA